MAFARSAFRVPNCYVFKKRQTEMRKLRADRKHRIAAEFSAAGKRLETVRWLGVE
jgi:hypothetical protein